MGISGAMFDLAKFNDVSKNMISLMTAEEVYDGVIDWASEYDSQLYSLLTRDKDYAISLFSIGRGGKKPRKDFASWNEVKSYISYFYDELFKIEEDFPQNISEQERKLILSDFAKVYSCEDDNNAWFEKLKVVSEKYGFTSDMKAYKENPDAFKGNITDVSNVIRVAITGRNNSPDLCSIMKVLGTSRVLSRLNNA
jgi:glutamyl-tRNA synthetase